MIFDVQEVVDFSKICNPEAQLQLSRVGLYLPRTLEKVPQGAKLEWHKTGMGHKAMAVKMGFLQVFDYVVWVC